MKKNYLFQVVVLYILLIAIQSTAQSNQDFGILVRVEVDDMTEMSLLERMQLDICRTRIANLFEVVVTQSQLAELQQQGMKTEIIGRPDKSVLIDPQYHTYQEVMALLDSLAGAFPNITYLDTIGTSQFHGNFIVAIKISDNAHIEEDEPAILYDGHHHAREPISMETCLAIIDFLLNNYGIDPQVTTWINETEIWLIPMLNPDGWKYIVEENISSPYWRKNQRDNNNNGIFNADYDGVDLNRNYDFHWSEGGSGLPDSWTYRGPAPFSESEIRAKRDLAYDQKFVLSLTYHSSGEVVIYPWNLDGNLAPDHQLIVQLADSVAVRIPTISGTGHYAIAVGNGNGGYSDVWMYGVMGAIEMTVETSTTFLPSGPVALQIAQDNIAGALYLLERVKGPGLTGHIKDINGMPLSATVKILEIYDPVLTPRTSDSLYGRYYRLLLPGTYTVEISKAGYQTVTLPNVVVGTDSLTQLDVILDIAVVMEDYKNGRVAGKSYKLDQNFPNPFNPLTTINYHLPVTGYVDLSIFNTLGQKVATLVSENLPAGTYQNQWDASYFAGGVYYYVLRVGNDYSETKKMLIIK